MNGWMLCFRHFEILTNLQEYVYFQFALGSKNFVAGPDLGQYFAIIGSAFSMAYKTC